MNDLVLQAHQFFKERVARGQQYTKDHHNGHADTEDSDDDEHDHGRDGEQIPDDVREIMAHENVFHRPKE